MSKPSTIAIDGPAASGKSTLALALAKKLGYLYFDTGLMYRAVTFAALQRGIDPAHEGRVVALAEAVTIDVTPPTVNDGRSASVFVDGKDVTLGLRSVEVEANVSVVSAYAGVREAMTRQQRRIGERGQVVMVGRDIGTVVLPDADLKIYLDASPEARARRRWLEAQAEGRPDSLEAILAAMKKRDEIDSRRAVSPLRAAEDAVTIDNTDMDVDTVVASALRLIENGSRRSSRPGSHGAAGGLEEDGGDG